MNASVSVAENMHVPLCNHSLSLRQFGLRRLISINTNQFMNNFLHNRASKCASFSVISPTTSCCSVAQNPVSLTCFSFPRVFLLKEKICHPAHSTYCLESFFFFFFFFCPFLKPIDIPASLIHSCIWLFLQSFFFFLNSSCFSSFHALFANSVSSTMKFLSFLAPCSCTNINWLLGHPNSKCSWSHLLFPASYVFFTLFCFTVGTQARIASQEIWKVSFLSICMSNKVLLLPSQVI